MGDIKGSLAKLRVQVENYAKEWGRSPDDICLIAVSKTKPLPLIEEAIEAGQKHFGENKVQEATAKFSALKHKYPGIQLHLIGPLQSNKVKDAVKIADFIHSVDREKLALLLAEEMKKQNKQPGLFIQVNIGEESQKAGIPPDKTAGFVEYCRSLSLPVEGLMCIPPADDDPSPYFALLAKMAKESGLAKLSMGMSGDFSRAIALGATHIRVGSAIFGERSG